MNFRINLRHLFLIFVIFSSAALTAFADGSEVEITQQLDVNPNDYIMDSPTEVSSKIRATAHKDQDNFSVKVDLANSYFVLPHPSEEQMEFYRNLSEADKAKFHKKRIAALNILARGLSSMKRGLGFGAMVKDKVMFWKPKKGQQLSFAERADGVVEGMLRAFDAKAWESAPVFADLKEMGFTGTGQIVAALGSNKRIDINKKVAGKKVNMVIPELNSGGAVGIGFTIGINFEQKSLIFQLFNANEQLKEVYLPLFYLAGNLKGGMYLSSSTEKLYSTQKGEGFYPFAVPGYSESAPAKKSFGGTMAFGIPTSPIDTGLTFKTTMQEQSYLRIRISPFTWKFIGVSAKNPIGIIKIAIKSIPQLLLEFKKIYQQFYYARSCRGLFI